MGEWSNNTLVSLQNLMEFGLKGMTATSFSSVSMEPPQILVCINQSA